MLSCPSQRRQTNSCSTFISSTCSTSDQMASLVEWWSPARKQPLKPKPALLDRAVVADRWQPNMKGVLIWHTEESTYRMGSEENHQRPSQPDRAAMRAQVKQGDGWQTDGTVNTLLDSKSPSKTSILPYPFDASYVPSILPRWSYTEHDGFLRRVVVPRPPKKLRSRTSSCTYLS